MPFFRCRTEIPLAISLVMTDLEISFVFVSKTNPGCTNVSRKLVYIGRNSQPQQLDAINFLAAAASAALSALRIRSCCKKQSAYSAR